MNQKQAGNILRRNAPPGEFPAFINPTEASWLKGMGGAGKKTKSGLRSFATGDPFEGAKGKRFAPKEAYDKAVNYVENFSDEQGAENLAAHQAQAMRNTGRGSGGSGVPPVWSASGGHETRTPTGPGSVTDPNDPHGIQRAVALGAKDLINKEYEAPTLSPEERIAATSAETTQAREGVQAMQGTGQGAYGEAAAVGKKISGQTIDPISGQSFLTGQGVDEYMSPHTSNVISGMQDNAMRTMQKQRNALQAQHQMAGAGMGSRGALENAAMSAEVQRGLGQQVAGALEGSYAQAAKMKQSDMEREQQRQRYNQMATGEQGRLNIAGA